MDIDKEFATLQPDGLTEISRVHCVSVLPGGIVKKLPNLVKKGHKKVPTFFLIQDTYAHYHVLTNVT